MKKKIKELFEYRKLPKILKYVPKIERKLLLKGLIDLQISIYNLDQYLEENWNLKDKQLKAYWEDIINKMRELGYQDNKIFAMTSHIRRYQLHETQLRDKLFPTRLNSQYYYHYKSCDVRLIRNIIKDYVPQFNNDFVDNWRCFDLITEINDDVTDVFEDQYTINGNLFLITILENNLDYAENMFIELIDNIMKNKPLKHESNSADLQDKILKWTLKEAESTRKLVIKNCKIIAEQKKPLKTKLKGLNK